MANKKVKIDPKAKAASTPTNQNESDTQGTDADVSSVPEVSTSSPEVKTIKQKTARAARKVAHSQSVESVEAQPAPIPNEPVKEQAFEKPVKMKRLTLDIPKPLHKAIKAKAVDEGISIVDMLRALLKEHYGR